MSDATSTVPNIESRSTIFEKLPPDLRRKLDQAIIDRDPPAYRDLHAKFNLAARGVSVTALYYYARRIRAQADMLYFAQLAQPDSPDLVEAVPTLFAYRLLDALIDEDTPPETLLRLVHAWRIASEQKLAALRRVALRTEPRP